MTTEFKDILFNVLMNEAQAIQKVASLITSDNIEKLLQIYSNLRKSEGALIICGVGKSGLIAQKLSSTFSSLGLRSFFLHPTEALHGDLGRVDSKDAIVFLSKSGTTEEIVKLLPYLPVPRDMRIGLLGKMGSPIGEGCGVVFNCVVDKEACVNDQAPTTSTTVALAMGDGLAILWEYFIGLSKEDFAQFHPGGILGKRLRLQVKDIMIPAARCACVGDSSSLKEVIVAMTERPLGACAITDDENRFFGIVVEGDIRRAFAKKDAALTESIFDIFNRNPKIISADSLAMQALEIMEGQDRQIQVLPVVENGYFLGLVRIHDLFREGL